MKDKYETVFQAHSLKFLIVALLLSFGFCDSYAFTDTFEVSVGETFTVQTTSKRGTYAIEWSYDSWYIQPVGTITSTSPRVTFRAVRKYQGLDFKVITRYIDNNLAKTHTDTYRVTITDDTKVSLPVTSLNLATGETQYLSASVDNNYYKGIYNWYSSNPDVVYASGYSDVGGITGKKPGNAIVTVELENGNKATCSVTVNNVDVNSASISPTSTTLKVGEKSTLSLIVLPSNATVTSKSWKSKNTSIATVDENGTVTAVSSGSTEIYCVVNGKITSNSCVVTVKEPVKPTGITVSPSSMNINIGDTKTLSYSLTPTDATTTVTWKSDNTSIATISSSGLVKGIAEGKTTIRATTSNGLSSTCIVNVKGIDTDYIFLPTLANVIAGSTTTLTYCTMPTNATNSVEWYSDDTSIATVTSSGIVKGIKEGSTVVRVKTDNGRCSSCKINVASSNVSPSDIKIINGPYHVEEGYSLRMYYELTPSDAITKLTWTSDDPSVMTVSKEGVITSKKTGSTYIRVKTYNGKESKLYVYSGNLEDDNHYTGYAQDGCLWSYKITDKEKRTCKISSRIRYDNKYSDLVVPSELCGYTVTEYSGCWYQDDVVSVTIPNTITEIPKEAFEHCTGLVTVFLPDNLKEIGEDAFSSCYSLKNINIPQTVISIGDWAFSYCESLEKIDLPENLAKIGRGTFFRCKSLKRFSVPKGITEIGSKAFNMCDNLEEIELPSNLQTIGEEAFGYSRNLKTIKCFMEKPIAIDESVFSTQFYWGIATLYVPFGTKSLYASADVWKNFKNIVEMEPEKIEPITVSQFLSKADTKTKYELTGVVKNISNTASGNFDLEQNGSKVYINGTLDKDGNAQKWGSLGVSEGDSIVLQGVYTTYNSAPAIKNAQYISHRRNMTVNLSKAGYATFYDSKNSFDLPKGLTAKVVTGVSNGKLEYRSLSDNVVPAGVAVMISGNANSDTYTLTQSLSEGRYSGSNMLYGSDETTTTSGDGYHYKLAYGHSGTSLSNVFGWYWGSDNGGAFKSEAHRAWLIAPKSTKTRSFSIEGETTDFVTVESDDTEDACYDLQGRRVKTPAKNGVYIINGKTRIVK